MNKKSKSPQAIKGSVAVAMNSKSELEKVMTLRQIEFARKYIVTMEASTAAKETGFVDYKRLVNNPKVKRYIELLRQELADKFNLDAESVIQELCKIAFFNPRDLYNKDGRMLRPEELPAKITAAIAEITEEMVGFDKAANQPLMKRRYKFHSKTTGLEMLAKHLGLFEKDNRQRNNTKVNFYFPANGRDPKLDERRTIDIPHEETKQTPT